MMIARVEHHGADVRRRALLAASLGMLALGGCSGSADPIAQPKSGPTYYRDVKPIVDARCTTCHTKGGIAPFALTSYDAIAKASSAVRDAVTTGKMPPWLAAEGCSEYVDDPTLPDGDVDTIARWVEAGAPAGDPADATTIAPPPDDMSRIDRTLTMPVTYAPKMLDDYRCFLLDWPEADKAYVTGFRADPGNPSIVHHVIAFVIPPAQVAQYQALDAAEDGAGYTCFGGPGGGSAPVSWIGGWAPGSRSGDFPAGTGLPIEAGSKIALQVHYNTANGVGEDKTSIQVELAKSVDKEATLQFWTNPQWIFDGGMTIPAGDPSVSYSFAADPTPYITNGQPFAIYSSMIHMHLRGTTGRLHILRQSGEDECLLDVPRWDFHWQLTYRHREPKIFNPGDRLGIDCTWDNSAANQPTISGEQVAPTNLQWGEGSGDEMCLGAFYIAQP